MFTGIVRERAPVESFSNGRLVVDSAMAAEPGDSIAVDGVCLTVIDRSEGRLAFDVVPETQARTKPFGSEVNLEPALRAGDPMGGHIVQGHVDGVGRVESFEREGEGKRLRVTAPDAIVRYCVEKGSVAVDGVSLTVAAIGDNWFEIALVPHTLEVTTLGALAPGDAVNLEVDLLAKYVEKLTLGSA